MPQKRWLESFTRHLVCQLCGHSLSFLLFLGRCSRSYYGIITPFSRVLENNWRVIGQRRTGARESNERRWKSIGTTSSNDSPSVVISSRRCPILCASFREHIRFHRRKLNEMTRQRIERTPRATKRVERWTVIRVRFPILSNWYFREN